MADSRVRKCSFKDVDFNVEEYVRVTFNREDMKDCIALNIANNRKLKRNSETYARDMRNGLWINGAGSLIVFNEDGRMIDGNGRMHAALLSGLKEMTFDIKTMAPNESFKVLDSGASRSDADACTFVGFENPQQVASISRVVQTLKNGACSIGSHRGINIAPSRQEIVDFATLNADVIKELATRFKTMSRKLKVRGMGPRQWFVAWWLTYCMNKEKAEEFITLVCEKKGIGRGLLRILDEPNEDGKAHSYDWLVSQYIDMFSSEMMGVEYELGANPKERVKGLKKLLEEYILNMRERDELFDWRFEEIGKE